MSDDTIDDSIKVTRREVIKGAGAIAAATVATAAVATVSSSTALAASAAETESGEKSEKQPRPEMNGAQAFFKVMVDGGIETVFGCPDTSEMQII